MDMPLKRKVTKSGLKLSKRKAVRTPAGTAVLYGQALVGNEKAREELRDALGSARKAYRRSSDGRGRPDLGSLLQDRKARREAGNAAASFQQALRTAGRKRKKPKSVKGPVLVVAAVAGTGTAVAVAKHRRDQSDNVEQAQPANESVASGT
jgi:hypothetical protein